MSINNENTNPPVCLSCGCYYGPNGECDCNRHSNGNYTPIAAPAIPADAVPAESVQAGTDIPTSLREAANGPWVISGPGFVPPEDPAKNPAKVESIGFRFKEDRFVSFFVTADVLDDPHVLGRFIEMVENEYPGLIPEPEGLFRDLHPDTVDASDLHSYRHVDIFTIEEMEAECARAGKQQYLVDGYVPVQSITLTIGDSGMGKSPEKYQQGICIAAGVDFFGLKVTQGRVLYIDFENNVYQSIGIAKDISCVLGLPRVPSDFRVWNAALSQQSWLGIVPKLVHEFKPTYVIIDTMSKAFPEAEDNNKAANKMLGELKQLTGAGCAVDIIHHLKKSSEAGKAPENPNRFDGPSNDLDREIQDLIKDSRGAGALYNGSDVRFLMRKPSQAKFENGTCEVELMGFRRVFGTLPTIFLERVRDDSSGKPLGYARLVGTRLLANSEHAKIFADLPEQFRWKHLEKFFGKSGRSKQLFINACVSLGLIEPLENGGGYRKVKRS